jgi:hypothetical protein
MVKLITILLVTFAACVCSSVAVADAPPDYDLTSQLEDACIHAKESGLPAPWLFGIEVSHRTFVVSLFGGPGRLALGRMAYQQLDPSVIH